MDMEVVLKWRILNNNAQVLILTKILYLALSNSNWKLKKSIPILNNIYSPPAFILSIAICSYRSQFYMFYFTHVISGIFILYTTYCSSKLLKVPTFHFFNLWNFAAHDQNRVNSSLIICSIYATPNPFLMSSFWILSSKYIHSSILKYPSQLPTLQFSL